MSARSVIAFPRGRRHSHGTVCVMGAAGAFEIGHESASGNTWGGFEGPFASGQDAIAAAYRLNEVSYGRQCDVHICDAALADVLPSQSPALNQVDF